MWEVVDSPTLDTEDSAEQDDRPSRPDCAFANRDQMILEVPSKLEGVYNDYQDVR